MTVLEEAKHHLATYGAAHTECCGTPLIRKLVAEMERLSAIEAAARELMDNSPTGDDDKPYCSDLAGREFDQLYLSLHPST
jgi:hypothetical protein